MEEKERYELSDNIEFSVIDNLNKEFLDYKTVIDILNQQSKRIKEFEQENQQLKQQLEEKDKDIKYFKESYYMIQDEKDHYAGQCLNLRDRIEELEKNNKRIRKNWENSKTQQTRLYNNLKQQLHDLPKKIVGEIRKEIEFPLYVHPDFDEFECLFDIDKLLDTILKKYGDKQ